MVEIMLLTIMISQIRISQQFGAFCILSFVISSEASEVL